jgi:pimeloyl-ACP methyl ester carboxylesterase
MKFGIFLVAATKSKFKSGDNDKAVEIFLRGVITDEAYEKLSPERMAQVKANVLAHRALFCYGSLPVFTEEDARSISTTAYLLTSEKTAEVQKHLNAYLAEILPHGKELHFGGVCHLMHEDDPAVIANVISAHIGAP